MEMPDGQLVHTTGSLFGNMLWEFEMHTANEWKNSTFKNLQQIPSSDKRNQVPLVLKNSRLHSMPMVPPCCV